MSEDPQLYAVYLGGDPAPGRLTEDHEVVLVVADDVAEARRRARAKWGASQPSPMSTASNWWTWSTASPSPSTPTERPESVDVDLTYEPGDDGPATSEAETRR